MLPPERLYLAHLAPYLMRTEKTLQAELKQTQAENDALALELQQQEEEVEHLIGRLEQVVKDIDGANGVMSEVIEGEKLGSEAREMEEEIRATGREAKL